MLSHYGVPLNQVQVSLIEPKNIAEAVKARQLDVLFVAGSATGQAINDVVSSATLNGQAPSFIPLDQSEGMAKRSPAFESVDIDAGTFGGNPPAPPEDLKSSFLCRISRGEEVVQPRRHRDLGQADFHVAIGAGGGDARRNQD